jgi:hypothetical protein
MRRFGRQASNSPGSQNSTTGHASTDWGHVPGAGPDQGVTAANCLRQLTGALLMGITGLMMIALSVVGAITGTRTLMVGAQRTLRDCRW